MGRERSEIQYREGSGMSGLGPMGDWGNMILPALG